MSLGRTAGYALLAVVDALAASALAGVVVFLVVPIAWMDPVLPTIAGAGLAFVVALLAGFVLARRGSKPFPMARLARGLLDRVPLWWP